MIGGMFLVFFCVIGLVFVISSVSSSNDRARLKALTNELDGEPHTSSSFTMMSSGHKVTFWRAHRAYGKSSVQWTEIDVAIPSMYPLAMFIRRQRSSDSGPIARGETIDVLLGDERFDREFLIEAAPEVVIKKLIDLPVMGFLLAHKEIELMTKLRGGARVIQLSMRGWLQTKREIDEAVGIAVGIAAKLRDAFSEAVAEVPMEQIGSPFRPEPDDHNQRLVEASHRSEVEHIEVLHDQRLSRDRAAAIVVLIIVVVAIVAFVAATAASRH